MSKPKFKRILLKLSGEALMGSLNYGLDAKIIDDISQEIKHVHGLGVEVAIVIGGGNIFLGIAASANGMGRGTADYMGILETVIKALALQAALEKKTYLLVLCLP